MNTARLTSAIQTMKKQLAMCEYTQLEEAQLKTDIRMCFAVNSENALLCTTGPTRRVDVTKSENEPMRSILSQLPGLRCRSGFSCFNIYPTSKETLDVNIFLWETVHNGFYDAEKGNVLFGENIFVLGLAAELFDFLVHVSLEALDRAMIDFLVLLHHQLTTDGDVIGVAKLREELLPEVWERVEGDIGVFENGEPKEAERAATLEHLVQISFMTPWRVDVFAGYLTPDDMSTAIAESPSVAAEKMPSFGADSVGVRGSALLKMFRDWQVYDEVLCKRLSMKRFAALEAMDRAIYRGRSVHMYEQAAAVVDQCENKKSWFSLLPIELVERAVVPWIVRRNCETMPPRRRRLATLKSLLELSSKFFDDLENGNGADGDVHMDDDELFGDHEYEGGDMETAIELNGLQIGQEANDEAWFHEDAPVEDGGGQLAAIGPNATDPFAEISVGGSAYQYGRRDDMGSEDEAGMEEYPLDAEPPRYSRFERHGGVIDLAVVTPPQGGGIDGGIEGLADAGPPLPAAESATATVSNEQVQQQAPSAGPSSPTNSL